jgi:hypothetical protein
MTERLITQVLLDRAWGGVAVNCNCRMFKNAEPGEVISELSFPSLSAIDRIKLQNWVRTNFSVVNPKGYFIADRGNFYAVKH